MNMADSKDWPESVMRIEDVNITQESVEEFLDEIDTAALADSLKMSVSAEEEKAMTNKEYNEKLKELIAKRNELDEIYYDESDPYAFDGDCIMQLHELADEAIDLAISGDEEKNDAC